MLCSLYLAPEHCPVDWSETAVGVDGQLAEPIGYLARTDLTDGARSRAEAVVPDLLRPLPTRPINVPQPTDERVRVVAAALPLLADRQPVSRVAHSVGYATASVFLAAFRRTLGTTPRRHLLSR
jgi:hypothetical protein